MSQYTFDHVLTAFIKQLKKIFNLETINQNEFEMSACYTTVNISLLFRRI